MKRRSLLSNQLDFSYCVTSNVVLYSSNSRCRVKLIRKHIDLDGVWKLFYLLLITRWRWLYAVTKHSKCKSQFIMQLSWTPKEEGKKMFSSLQLKITRAKLVIYFLTTAQIYPAKCTFSSKGKSKNLSKRN